MLPFPVVTGTGGLVMLEMPIGAPTPAENPGRRASAAADPVHRQACQMGGRAASGGRQSRALPCRDARGAGRARAQPAARRQLRGAVRASRTSDFVFPLLNRGGFLNSEMMLPLLCTRLGLPYLGASPILRGLADDKHLTKLAAPRARRADRALGDLPPRRAGRAGALPRGRAHGDQAQRLLGQLGRAGRARLGRRRGARSPTSTARAMTRSSSPSSTAATSRCR